MSKLKLIRITTVPISLNLLIKGQMRFMTENNFEVIVASAKGNEIEQVIKNEGCKHKTLPLTRKITPLKDIWALYVLYRFFKKEKPGIVHTHTPKAGTIGMIAAKLAGVPNRLHTIAGLPLLEAAGNKRRLLNFVEKVTYSCATKIYPNSFGLKDIILKNKFCKPNKLKVIANGSSNGIDTWHYDSSHFTVECKNNLREELGINKNDFVFIFVGRLVGDKGINELIDAFSKLQTPNSKLLLVGPLEAELDPLQKSTLNEIEQNKSIKTVGYQNDVRPYFTIANALVFPSYREGFPNVVLQAGAMGLPCVVSNINGCNEIIVENLNGIIIPVKDTMAIYDAMKKMVEDVSFYNQLIQNSRKRIVENYEQIVVWEAILEEYKYLLKNV